MNKGRLAVAIGLLAVVLALAYLPFTAGDAHGANSGAYAMQLGKLIDDYRARRHLPSLSMDPALSQLSAEHATRMARENRLSHEGFEQRFARARSPRCVENVGVGAGGPEQAFDAWRHSPVHDRNLRDGSITRMGIGVDAGYVAFFACR
jgi:uncharacterized protein YkwD